MTDLEVLWALESASGDQECAVDAFAAVVLLAVGKVVLGRLSAYQGIHSDYSVFDHGTC